MNSAKIRGYCPMGCGETLAVRLVYVAAIDEALRPALIYCTNPACPKLDAAQKILDDPETEHIVTLDYSGASVKHPLRERIDNELLTCALGAHLVEFGREYLSGGMGFGDPIPMYVSHRVRWVGQGEETETEWEPMEPIES